MYNVIIGNSCYSKMAVSALLDMERPIICIGTKEDLENMRDLRIIKQEADIINIDMVRMIVKSQNVSSIYILTDNDKINLMLSDALQEYGKLYVIFNDKKFMELVNKKCKAICLSKILRDFIYQEEQKIC